MNTRIFGKTGVAVSELTLGTMRFLRGWETPHDELPDESLANVQGIIATALAAGVNLIETARGYGKSERLIGRSLAALQLPRSRYLLMTKATVLPTAAEMRVCIAESLQRLGVDYLDFFALHGMNDESDWQQALVRGGALEGVEQARAEGLLRHVGFSTHAPLALILKLIATKRFDFVNLHYYFFRPENRPAVMAASAAQMGVFIISPNDKGGHLYAPPERLSRMTAPLHPVHFNERWLLKHPEIHTLSLGLSDPRQMAIHLESLAADSDANSSWGNQEEQILHRLQEQIAHSPYHACLSCRDCLPCPVGIDIPEVLRFVLLVQQFNMVPFSRLRYSEMRVGDRWVPGEKANLCNACNHCLPRCPEKLPIPALLQRAHHLLTA